MATPDARNPLTDGKPRPPLEREITVRNVAVATVCMIGFALSYGMFGYTLGISMIPMTTQFHWSRTEFSFAMTFMTLSGAIMFPFIGRIIDRVGVKPVVLVGATVAGLTAMLISRQTANVTTFYAAFAVLGACGPIGIGYMKIIAALFKRNRGKMLALFGVESSVAMAGVPWALGQIYLHYGWPMLYIAAGAAMLCLLPMIALGLPSAGKLAVIAGHAATEPTAKPVLPGLTISQAARTQPFWIILSVSVVILGPLTGAIPHVIPFLEQKGFSVTVATTYASISLLLGFVGAAYAGLMLDRFNTAKIAAPSYAAMAIGMFLLLTVTPTFGGFALLYTAASFGGFAASSTSPMNTYFHTRFFGLRAFTEVMGWERGVTAVVAAIGAPVMGYVYDQTHSYHAVFVFLVFPPIVAATLYLFIGRYRYAANIETAPAEPMADTSPLAIAIGAPAE